MLKKILLPTLVISGTLFASFSLFVITQGSKPMQIDYENRRVFDGRVRDVISPLIGAGLSLGAGIASATVLVWRQSARKTSILESQLNDLEKLISQKDSEIQNLRLSPVNPRLAELSFFLDDEQFESQVDESIAAAMSQEEQAQEQAEDEEEMKVAQIEPQLATPNKYSSYAVYNTIVTPPNTQSVNDTTAMFPNTQSVLGLTQNFGNRK